MSEGEKHSIRKGDWIIRDPATPPPNMAMFDGFPAHRETHDDYHTFTDHAVYVIDSTQSHLTLFDPLIGRPMIIVFDRFPGMWRYATASQVETTWLLAKNIRRDHAMQIELEINNFKYRPKLVRDREKVNE